MRALNLKFRLHRQKKFHTSGQKVFLDTCAIKNDTFFELINLLYDYRDIFVHFETDIPECNLLKCHLSTYADAKPTRSKPYRLSDEMRV